MEIVAEYSHKGGKNFLKKYHKNELEEIREIISLVDASVCKTKESEEKLWKEKCSILLKPWTRGFLNCLKKEDGKLLELTLRQKFQKQAKLMVGDLYTVGTY